MKINLTQTNVLHSKMNINFRPFLNENGKVDFEDNPSKTPYIVFDSSQDSPVGFGLKVAATKKTFIVQRKHFTKVIKFKVGDVGLYTLDEARDEAKKLLQTMIETGLNPNKVKRTQYDNEITLGKAMGDYRNHITTRNQKTATANTLIVFDKAVRKLEEWKELRVKDISDEMILKKFDSIFATHPTSAEQHFRWASVAVRYELEKEKAEANKQGRLPTLTFNPFDVLKQEKKYRSRQTLEDIHKLKRHPMREEDTLPKFLDALWSFRKSRRTGTDYFLLTLLIGTRKNEGLDLKWRSRITDKEADTCSYADLQGRTLFFFDTKNRKNHRLPMTDAVYVMLTQRFELSDERLKNSEYVFPAESSRSQTGHYTDHRSLLNSICEAVKLEGDKKFKIGAHDLRRTFGRYTEELCSYAVVKALLNHSDLTDPTLKYTDVSERLLENLQRVELHLLKNSPVIYNALLTPKYNPI